MRLKNKRPTREGLLKVADGDFWSRPGQCGANRGEAIARWRLTWEIDPQDWHPAGFDGRMETWFYTWNDFADYQQTLLMAQREGMCRNVRSFEREVTVGEWGPVTE